MNALIPLLRVWLAGWPDWLVQLTAMLLAGVVVLGVFLTMFALLTWIERKTLGRIQNRYGPNRTGPVGLFQPIADALKLLFKEDVVPRPADRLVHTLAPVVAVVPPILVLSLLPVSPAFVPVNIAVGMLLVFAVSTASVLAVFMAGWASRNKFSLLGAMRGVAQVVSYEVPMVLSALVVVMSVGSLSTVAIVEAQAGGWANVSGWFVFRPWGVVGFVLFTIGVMAEAGRTPFDIPEAESEIVAGYHTEYSGFKFALFQMAEYLAVLTMAGFAVTLFLGGYCGPGSGRTTWGGVIGAGWFLVKLSAVIGCVIWIRGTWPRVRVDQLLGLGWKVLLPLALVNIVAAALWHFVPAKPLAWVVSAGWLAGWLWLLLRLGNQKLEQRNYRFIT